MKNIIKLLTFCYLLGFTFLAQAQINLDVEGDGIISEKLGVGLSNPSSRLHILGDGSLIETVDIRTGDITAGKDLINLYLGSNSTDDTQLIEARRGAQGIFQINANGQTGIGVGANLIDASAMLDIKATDMGVLIPRMTSTQRSVITSPAKGLFVFDNTTSSFWYYDGSTWVEGMGGNSGGSSIWMQNSADAYYSSGNIGIGTNTPSEELTVVGQVKATYASDETEYVTIGHGGANGFIETEGDGNLDFRHDGNTLMTLEDTGNVGIGTSSPSQKLHIGGNGNLRIDGSNSTYSIFNTYQGGSGETILQIDPYNTDNTKTSAIRLFRSVDASEVSFAIMKGNNTTQTNHLLRGNSDSFLSLTGNVGIGTTDPLGYKLAVNGNIGAEEIEVRTNYWADFVFEEDYELRSLKEVEAFIEENGHLPTMPSEQEAINSPINLGDMDVKLLQTVEEQMLYILQLKEQNEKQQAIIESLETRLSKLENQNK